jgi:hypothetical protein
LVEAATPLKIAEPPSQPIPKEVAQLAALEKQVGKVTGLTQLARRECPAFLLSLSNEWFPCSVEHHPNGPFYIRNATGGIVGGMSGSPIISKNGAAIGIVCLSAGSSKERHTEGGPNPRLMGNLPAWFLKGLKP